MKQQKKNKKCIKCKQIKDIDNFTKNKYCKDGYFSYCKTCAQEYAKINRLENHEHIIVRERKRYKKDKNKINLHNKDRYINDEVYRNKANKDSKAYRDANPLKCWASNTWRCHKRRGCIMVVTKQEILEKANNTKFCPICQVELLGGIKGTGGACFNSPSLDRIDNGNILTKDNVWIICHSCNSTKRNRTLKEFIEYCKLVIKNIKVEDKPISEETKPIITKQEEIKK